MTSAEQKLIAGILYELRLILGVPDHNAPDYVQFAGRLAYAVHNDALAMMRGNSYNIENTLCRIAVIDQIIGGDQGEQLAAKLRLLLQEPN